MEKNCKVRKLMNFYKDMELFEGIFDYHRENEGEREWMTMSAIKEEVSYSLE